jgi:hypothetical protein
MGMKWVWAVAGLSEKLGGVWRTFPDERREFELLRLICGVDKKRRGGRVKSEGRGEGEKEWKKFLTFRTSIESFCPE